MSARQRGHGTFRASRRGPNVCSGWLLRTRQQRLYTSGVSGPSSRPERIGVVTYAFTHDSGTSIIKDIYIEIDSKFKGLGLSHALFEQVVARHPATRIERVLMDKNEDAFYRKLTDLLRDRLGLPPGVYFSFARPVHFLDRGITETDLQTAARTVIRDTPAYKLGAAAGYGAIVEADTGFQRRSDGTFDTNPVLVVRRMNTAP